MIRRGQHEPEVGPTYHSGITQPVLAALEGGSASGSSEGDAGPANSLPALARSSAVQPSTSIRGTNTSPSYNGGSIRRSRLWSTRHGFCGDPGSREAAMSEPASANITPIDGKISGSAASSR